MLKSVKQLRERRTSIVRQLSELSKDGWRHAKPLDYMPLERELVAIEEQLQRRGAR